MNKKSGRRKEDLGSSGMDGISLSPLIALSWAAGGISPLPVKGDSEAASDSALGNLLTEPWPTQACSSCPLLSSYFPYEYELGQGPFLMFPVYFPFRDLLEEAQVALRTEHRHLGSSVAHFSYANSFPFRGRNLSYSESLSCPACALEWESEPWQGEDFSHLVTAGWV